MLWRLVGITLVCNTLAVLGVVTLLLDQEGPSLSPWNGILIALVTILAALMPSLYVVRRLALPMRSLVRDASQITNGHAERIDGPDMDGELRTLADSFNIMNERLRSQISQLEQDRYQLRAILSGMIEGVIAMDTSQRVLFANERAARLLGFKVAEAVGQRFWELVRQPSLQALLEQALVSDEPTRGELDFFGPGVRSIGVYASRLPQAAAGGAILVLHDITELRHLERIRQDFVANASHELKTPLAVIMASIETLIDGAVESPKVCGPLMEQIAEQSARLESLIEDMLTLARAESQSMDLRMTLVTVASAVADCIDRHRVRANARRQNLIADPPEDLRAVGLSIWGDEQAIACILDNLVDNALKYTNDGGTVQIRWTADDEMIQITVEDNGIGIPAKDLPRIFERFYRVDKARSRRVGGTGLGLSIVKHLVGALSGTIHASSEFGRGSTFRVCLPRARDV